MALLEIKKLLWKEQESLFILEVYLEKTQLMTVMTTNQSIV